MRLGATSSPSRPAAISELRPRYGLFVAMAGGVSVVAGMLLLQPPSGAEIANECEAVTQAAVALQLQHVAPRLNPGAYPVVDCREALVAAGVPVGPLARQWPDGRRVETVVEFERPQRVSADRIIVNYGVICGPLCGQGYRAELVRRNGRWEVVARSETWIS
jgi:hypothetical protein